MNLSKQTTELRELLDEQGISWEDDTDTTDEADYYGCTERTYINIRNSIVLSCIYGYINLGTENIGRTKGYPDELEVKIGNSHISSMTPEEVVDLAYLMGQDKSIYEVSVRFRSLMTGNLVEDKVYVRAESEFEAKSLVADLNTTSVKSISATPEILECKEITNTKDMPVVFERHVIPK